MTPLPLMQVKYFIILLMDGLNGGEWMETVVVMDVGLEVGKDDGVGFIFS